MGHTSCFRIWSPAPSGQHIYFASWHGYTHKIDNRFTERIWQENIQEITRFFSHVGRKTAEQNGQPELSWFPSHFAIDAIKNSPERTRPHTKNKALQDNIADRTWCRFPIPRSGQQLLATVFHGHNKKTTMTCAQMAPTRPLATLAFHLSWNGVTCTHNAFKNEFKVNHESFFLCKCVLIKWECLQWSIFSSWMEMKSMIGVIKDGPGWVFILTPSGYKWPREIWPLRNCWKSMCILENLDLNPNLTFLLLWEQRTLIFLHETKGMTFRRYDDGPLLGWVFFRVHISRSGL